MVNNWNINISTACCSQAAPSSRTFRNYSKNDNKNCSLKSATEQQRIQNLSVFPFPWHFIQYFSNNVINAAAAAATTTTTTTTKDLELVAHSSLNITFQAFLMDVLHSISCKLMFHNSVYKC